MAAPRELAEGAGLGGHALDLVWVSDPRAASPRHCLAVNSSAFPRSLSQPLDPTCVGPCHVSHLISCYFPLLPPHQLHRPPCSLHMPSQFPSHSLFTFCSLFRNVPSAVYLYILLLHSNLFKCPPLPTRPYHLFTNSTSCFPLSRCPDLFSFITYHCWHNICICLPFHCLSPSLEREFPMSNRSCSLLHPHST